MEHNPLRRRLILILFALACVSVALSTALLVGYLLGPRVSPSDSMGDPLGHIETDLSNGRSSSAWEGLLSLSKRDGFKFGTRGLTLLWKTWQREPREALLREISANAHDHASSDDERALSVYLLLEAGQGEWAIRLDKPGYWSSTRPDLEAELSLFRAPPQTYRFASFNTPRYRDDARIQLDRAYALGYLGDYQESRVAAAAVIDASDPPGTNGSTGIIDPARGLCRRQAARMIQIMSVWDGSDPQGEKLMREALIELMVDPDGLLKVAPRYFDFLQDAAAFTGEKSQLEKLYMVSDIANHPLYDEHRENRALIEMNPVLRPETYTDLRGILASNDPRDPRFRPTVLYDAAGKHDDERAWRLASWFLWNTGDFSGLDGLLERKNIVHGAWSRFWTAVENEAAGDLPQAVVGFKSARSGSMDGVALLNQARVTLRQGKVETAAVLAADARQGIQTRSLGLYKISGNGYSSLYADALALEARIMRAQGRESEAESFLRELYSIDPNHPELYNARGMPEKPPHPVETPQ